MSSQKSAAKAIPDNHLEVFDPNFKNMYLVPSHLVVHTPPGRTNLTRLVHCRNYKAHYSASCSMGDSCKFVHADVDYDTLQAQPIHVNYIWRDESLCTYRHLPSGGYLDVLLPNNKQPMERIPSERILMTQGALPFFKGKNRPVSHCAHYYFNQLCYRGERCNFIHALYVDPTISTDFKRVSRHHHRQRGADQAKAPPAAKGAGETAGQNPRQGSEAGAVESPHPVVREIVLPSDPPLVSLVHGAAQSAASSDDAYRSVSGGDDVVTPETSVRCRGTTETQKNVGAFHGAGRSITRVYRHDPYQLLK
ncbi:uncharacterized protein TM35_000034790 [Trypanosoma theileri]|uniref:C3H1-type domain-containing protein n=1 Tax=Trypanosoma theileri TaxID=67003 RepID=A0A1X0P703_9TRYP|nr:uncharacterized protein TM35_000034790 [Trypanosoma theileri]ORC92726.1 hypothetical protein TM35_000034790 [Trypanosoma theileri]